MARTIVEGGLRFLFADEGLGPRARRDIERGVRSGRLTTDNTEVAFAAAGGALLGLVKLLELHPDRNEEADSDQLAHVLLLSLGLSPTDAAEIVSRPLPELLAN